MAAQSDDRLSLDNQTSRSGVHAPRVPMRPWRRAFRLVLVGFLLITGLPTLGVLYQAGSTAMDASRYPAPSGLFNIGGFRLHLDCTGMSQPGTPTVILDEGLGATSLGWSEVQPRVGSFARVCSYDRAGYGFSDDGPLPRTAGRMVTELHTLLGTAGIEAPYILVGHSFGGLVALLYTYDYSRDVAGLVLVESVSPDEFALSLPLREAAANDLRQLHTCRQLSPFGMVRLFGFFEGTVSGYPASVQPEAKAQVDQTRFCQTVSDEEESYAMSFAQVQQARHPLGPLPLVVLSRGQPDPDPQLEQDWQMLQRSLTGLSDNSTQMIADSSGHQVQIDQPDLVVAAIQRVLTGSAR